MKECMKDEEMYEGLYSRPAQSLLKYDRLSWPTGTHWPTTEFSFFLSFKFTRLRAYYSENK